MKSSLIAAEPQVYTSAVGAVNLAPTEHPNRRCVLWQLGQSDHRNFGFSGWVHVGGLGQVSVSCLHSSHSGSRCTTTIVLGPDFNTSVLVAWWKQCLRDTRVNCQHTYDWGGAEGCANNMYFVRPHKREHWHMNSSSRGILRSSSPTGSPTIRHTAIRNAAQKKILGFILQQLWSRPCPWQGSDRAKKEALFNIRGNLWSLQQQSHLLSRQ